MILQVYPSLLGLTIWGIAARKRAYFVGETEPLCGRLRSEGCSILGSHASQHGRELPNMPKNCTPASSANSADDGENSPLTPEEWALRAQKGSMFAFEQLVKHFEGRLFNFILRRSGNYSDAEELTQETFIRAWERIERYDDRWRFSTWLFTIGSRLTISHHRAKKRTVSSDTLNYQSCTNDGPVEICDRRNCTSPTWNLAGRVLSDAQQTALWLRYAEDLSIREIACVMGKTQVSIRVTLFRARDQLAQELQKVNARRAGDSPATVDTTAEGLDLELAAAGGHGMIDN